MKIKDVEKETGISIHSIRFYEDMGLIQVQRDPDNKYRDFTEQDVKKLKEIKLFRGLGITMEEIKRYQQNEITLEELMDHQMKELAAQHDDMRLKEKLCEDIKESKSPLISYTVNQYEEIMQHQREKTPYENAGSLLTSWNQMKNNENRSQMIIIISIPFIFMSIGIAYITISKALAAAQYTIFTTLEIFLVALILFTVIFYFFYNYRSIIIEEMYEFREKGIYYISKETVKNKKIKRTWSTKKLHSYMDFLSYQDIDVLKIWFHQVARAPLTGNIYQVDFYLLSSEGNIIHIDTGLFGVSDEKIKITAEICKEYAKKIIDPFHILEHLDDDRYVFQDYLDAMYSKKERQRVYGTQKKR